MGHLHFYEALDPVRAAGAQTRYLDELGELVRTRGNAEGSAGGECIAAWVPVFLTGYWPCIVTFWEMPGGWGGFSLLGGFRTAFRNGTEVVLLLAFPNMAPLVRAEERPADFPAYSGWLLQSRKHEPNHTGLVLRPTSWPPLK